MISVEFPDVELYFGFFRTLTSRRKYIFLFVYLEGDAIIKLEHYNGNLPHSIITQEMEEVEEELEKKTAEEEERRRKEMEVSFNRNVWEL